MGRESLPSRYRLREDYRYRLLKEGQIRILGLKPGSFGKPIRCKLKLLTLEDTTYSYQKPKTQYEAISYACGDAKDTTWIVCNRAPMEITRSLYSALKHLRLSDETRYLWADALCINQKDNTERNHQVQDMGKIYASARRVLIWLGEETPEVKGGLMNLAACLEYRPPHIDWPAAKIQWISKSKLTFSEDGQSQEAVKWLRYQQVSFPPVMHIFTRSWWCRKWVVQELVRAKQALLICGWSSMPWGAVERILGVSSDFQGLNYLSRNYERQLRISDDTSTLAIDGLLNGKRLARATEVGYTKKLRRSRELANIFIWTNMFQCSDPHDHLYSLFGIAQDIYPDFKDLLRVDYGASVATVSTRLSIYLLSSRREWPLWHLHAVTGTRRQHSSMQMDEGERLQLAPSWVCAFLDPSITTLPHVIWSLTKLDFKAGRYHDRRPPVWDLATDNQVLSIRGIIIGEVTIIEAPALFSNIKTSLSQPEISKWGLKIWSIIKSYEDTHRKALELFHDLVTCGGEHSRLQNKELSSASLYDAQLWLDWVQQERAGYEDGPSLFTDAQTANFNRSTDYAVCRQLCTISSGHVGWLPPTARVGDQICCFPGDDYLYVISFCGEGHYTIIGQCYIQGLMWGEAMELGLGKQWIHFC